jgi:hypothetical protein
MGARFLEFRKALFAEQVLPAEFKARTSVREHNVKWSEAMPRWGDGSSLRTASFHGDSVSTFYCPGSLSDLPMNIVFSPALLIALKGACLDRLLKQRFALRESSIRSYLPPQRGRLRSLSGGPHGRVADPADPFPYIHPEPTNS